MTDATDVRWPRPLAAVGAAATTFLLVAAAVVGLLAVEFSALVALPLGGLAALGTLAAVALTVGGLSPARRRAVYAYAAFGPAVLAVLALSYVNVARDVVTVRVAVGVGLVATAAVYAALRTGADEGTR